MSLFAIVYDFFEKEIEAIKKIEQFCTNVLILKHTVKELNDYTTLDKLTKLIEPYLSVLATTKKDYLKALQTNIPEKTDSSEVLLKKIANVVCTRIFFIKANHSIETIKFFPEFLKLLQEQYYLPKVKKLLTDEAIAEYTLRLESLMRATFFNFNYPLFGEDLQKEAENTLDKNNAHIKNSLKTIGVILTKLAAIASTVLNKNFEINSRVGGETSSDTRDKFDRYNMMKQKLENDIADLVSTLVTVETKAINKDKNLRDKIKIEIQNLRIKLGETSTLLPKIKEVITKLETEEKKQIEETKEKKINEFETQAKELLHNLSIKNNSNYFERLLSETLAQTEQQLTLAIDNQLRTISEKHKQIEQANKEIKLIEEATNTTDTTKNQTKKSPLIKQLSQKFFRKIRSFSTTNKNKSEKSSPRESNQSKTFTEKAHHYNPIVQQQETTFSNTKVLANNTNSIDNTRQLATKHPVQSGIKNRIENFAVYQANQTESTENNYKTDMASITISVKERRAKLEGIFEDANKQIEQIHSALKQLKEKLSIDSAPSSSYSSRSNSPRSMPASHQTLLQTNSNSAPTSPKTNNRKAEFLSSSSPKQDRFNRMRSESSPAFSGTKVVPIKIFKTENKQQTSEKNDTNVNNPRNRGAGIIDINQLKQTFEKMNNQNNSNRPAP